MKILKILFYSLAILFTGCKTQNDTTYKADIIIYGGTSAAVIAAVEAVQSGKTVLVVSPDKHLGGLTAGGLGYTDTGNKAVIGGLSRDFYHCF
jgi:ribulose 1,5-bisphosphate synthetase/thiazole synthase